MALIFMHIENIVGYNRSSGPAAPHLDLQPIIWTCSQSSGNDKNDRSNKWINKSINFTLPVRQRDMDTDYKPQEKILVFTP